MKGGLKGRRKRGLMSGRICGYLGEGRRRRRVDARRRPRRGVIDVRRRRRRSVSDARRRRSRGVVDARRRRRRGMCIDLACSSLHIGAA